MVSYLQKVSAITSMSKAGFIHALGNCLASLISHNTHTRTYTQHAPTLLIYQIKLKHKHNYWL